MARIAALRVVYSANNTTKAVLFKGAWAPTDVDDIDRLEKRLGKYESARSGTDHIVYIASAYVNNVRPERCDDLPE